jgi:capsular exopolysaccharide synthesis family protein
MTTGRVHTSGAGAVTPTLLDYFRVLGRQKWIFLLTLVLVPAIAVMLSLKQTPVYQASADVLLSPNTAGTLPGGQPATVDPARVAETQAQLARVPAVVEISLHSVSGNGLTVEQFLKASSVAATLGSDLLTFSVKNSDARMATRLATAYAKAFTEYKSGLDTKPLEERRDGVRKEIARLEAEGATDTDTYSNLVKQEQQLRAALAVETPTAQVVREADRAEKIAPRTVRNGAIAIVLGLLLALGVAFLGDALDTRVRSVDVLRDVLGIPLLGQLPAPSRKREKEGGLVMLADPMSQEAEMFRTLRANLNFANSQYQAQVIMVTSATGAEGKSTTAANLAVALARAGRTVVLIDADLRSPHLHQLFGLDEKPGLIDVELGDAEIGQALRAIDLADTTTEYAIRAPRAAGSLEVLTVGHALHDPDQLGAEAAVARVVESIRHRADIVLVDAAPLLPVGDAVALSSHVDALLLVARLKGLRLATLEELERILSVAPARKLGIIVTGVPPSRGYPMNQRYGVPPPTSALEPLLEWTARPKEAAGEQGTRRDG